MLRGVPNAVEVLAKFRPGTFGEQSPQDALQRAKKDAEFANSEIERGFPALHAHAVVAIWGALEASIEDLLVAWVLNKPEVLQNEAFAKLKVSLGDFLWLEREEQARLLIRELERASSQRRGIERFESLLQAIGQSGSIDEGVRKSLFEMFQVRNVLVHRAGSADRRIAEACPWLNLTVGAPVLLDHQAFRRYVSSVDAYIANVMERVFEPFGIVRSEGDAGCAGTENPTESES